jgi:hypothetical protein
MKPQQK